MSQLYQIMMSPEGRIAGALWVTVCGAVLVIAITIATREKKPAKPEPTQFKHEWERRK